jgi:nicotinate dehydrogenase subunit A
MIRLIVNGMPREVAAEPGKRLVEVLRDDLKLTGTKFGCGQGRCGACTVIVEDRAVRSCQVTVHAVAGQAVTTIEGLGSADCPDPVLAAVREAQASQCGHCGPGIVLAVKAFLGQVPRPSEAQVREVVQEHECMCGSRSQVVKAVLRLTAPPKRR